MQEADHEETSPGASLPLIHLLECAVAGQTRTVHLLPGTVAASAYNATAYNATTYGRSEAQEAFRCRFGLNPAYRDQVLREPLRVAGVDDNGEVRIVELADHPFYVATLFLPQLSSRPGEPHPLIAAYLVAASNSSEAAH